MSTLTVAVEQAKMAVGHVYTKFYCVDTNGCSSNAQCKQAKKIVDNVYAKLYSADTSGCSSIE